MRFPVWLLLLASGCSLYFEPHGQTADDQPPPDAWILSDAPRWPDASWPDSNPPYDGGGAGDSLARCEDGVIYAVQGNDMFSDGPPHGSGRVVGTCPGVCRSSAVVCSNASCSGAAETLCNAPVSLGATCPLDGARCEGSAPLVCPETTACSQAVPGSTCACSDGRYRCEQDTAAATVQSRIVGKWRGMVTWPFGAPYAVTLWIYPDGTYWPDCAGESCRAFWYAGDGPSPDRKITIQSTSPTEGSWGEIVIHAFPQSTNRGALTALVVDAKTLRFSFTAAWDGCGQPFEFNLTRY